jgi:hypothetical protein
LLGESWVSKDEWYEHFGEPQVFAREVITFGWPLRFIAVDSNIGYSSSLNESGKHEIVSFSNGLVWHTKKNPGGAGAAMRCIPMKYDMPNLLGNIAIYVVIYLTTSVIVRQIITRRRNRLGVCVRCAYARSGESVCPECGEIHARQWIRKATELE